jgi:hypothetical protein
MGYTDVIASGSFVIDTVTGGFAPSAEQLSSICL